MIRIAICSDDNILCTKLKIMAQGVIYSHSAKSCINIFSPSKHLSIALDTIKSKSFYNIFFIDMDSKSINGLDLGCKIRKKLGLEISQIIYLSSKQENAFKIFKTAPIGFILKPITYEDISEAFDNVFSIFKSENETFEYHFGRKLYKAHIKDIIYFQSHNRVVDIVMKTGISSFYGTLNEVYNQIDNSYFLFTHKSYLINCHYIKKFEYCEVVMSNNDILPISQINRKSLRPLLLDFEKTRSISRVSI